MTLRTFRPLPSLIPNIWAIPSSGRADRKQSALTEVSQLRLEGELLHGYTEEHTEQKEAGPEGNCFTCHQSKSHSYDLYMNSLGLLWRARGLTTWTRTPLGILQVSFPPGTFSNIPNLGKTGIQKGRRKNVGKTRDAPSLTQVLFFR